AVERDQKVGTVFAGGADNLIQHVVHRARLMPLITAVPAFTSLEAGAVRIARVVFVPCGFGMFAEAKRISVAAMISVKLNAEDVEEQLVDFVAREQFVDHSQDVLAIRRVETSYVPA